MAFEPGLGKNLNRGDNMSRCSDNQSVFDYIRNPNMPPLSKQPAEWSRDILESNHAQLEKEAAHRLIKDYKILAVFFSGGKIFLLVLVLPLRFTLFTFPKFVALEVLPSALEIIKPLFGKLEEMKKKLEVLIKKSSLVFVRFKRYPLLVQKQIERFVKKVSERIRGTFVRLTSPVVKALDLAKGLLQVIVKTVIHHLSPAVKFLKSCSVAIKERSVQFAAWVKSPASSVRQFFSLPLLLPRASGVMKDAALKIRQHVIEAAATMKEVIVSKVVQASHYVSRLAQGIKSQALQYARPIGETIAQGSRKFADSIKAPVVAMAKGILSRTLDLRALITQQAEKMTLLVKNSFTNIQNNFKQGLIPSVFQSAKQSALRFIEGRLTMLVKVAEKYSRGVAAILKSFERIKLVAKEMMNKMNDKRRELFQQFKQIIPQIKRKALECIEIVKIKFLTIFQKFMAFLRALLIFSKKLKIIAHQILIIGRHLIRELVTELKSWS